MHGDGFVFGVAACSFAYVGGPEIHGSTFATGVYQHLCGFFFLSLLFLFLNIYVSGMPVCMPTCMKAQLLPPFSLPRYLLYALLPLVEYSNT